MYSFRHQRLAASCCTIFLCLLSLATEAIGKGTGARYDSFVPHAIAIIGPILERHNAFRPYNIRLLIFRSARGIGQGQGSHITLTILTLRTRGEQ
ncbi:uncharacterized protein BT62DRAFT_937038 [Guyanagaster necrorhizus]|uniref:Secreted protein n=1 Tax=Guyanagaster necrorhizus TaxID=856835 RepID=A0A9P8AP52_9AGAR|nr:uncharacterized protein BT62DRAFT_937038 [Guyanagaster necrorhizus MCA 3950]KAG7441517.1 hypothetical protein BT62DRAFT_937038 [Guyanagaster necrorhizus MCA 3950]